MSKGIILILLVVGFISSISVGCSSKKTDDNTDVKKIVEISALAYDRGSIPLSEGTLEDNWFTKWVNETASQKIGVKVKYIPVPNSHREQKLATLLASGDAPDVCFAYDNNIISNYTANGGLTDLQSLLDQNGTNLKKKIDQSYFDQVKINNQLTCIPLITNGTVDATWIRKDWLDKLNLKAPANIDEFYNVLKQFKEKDPGNLGEKNVPFALSAATGYSFQYIDSSILPAFVKSAPTGEKLVIPWYFWPEAKDAVRFLNKLYNEKLMGQFVIDKDGAQIKKKIMSGELGSTINFATYMYQPAYGNIEENLQKNIPEASYTATYPWKAADSKENYYQFFKGGISNSMRFFIPKSSKKPEAAMKYLDFMATDEYINTMYYGFENNDYKAVNGIPQYVDDAAKARCTWVQPAYQSTMAQNVEDDQKYIQYGTAVFNPKFADQYVKESIAGEKYYKYAIPFISQAKPASDKYKADLDKKWDQYLAKLIIATTQAEFDKTFDEAINTLKAEGGNEVVKEAVELYRKQNSKK